MNDLPKFDSDEQAATWFDSHDTAAYMGSMEAVAERFPVTRTPFATRPLDIRLRADQLEAIEQLAE